MPWNGGERRKPWWWKKLDWWMESALTSTVLLCRRDTRLSTCWKQCRRKEVSTRGWCRAKTCIKSWMPGKNKKCMLYSVSFWEWRGCCLGRGLPNSSYQLFLCCLHNSSEVHIRISAPEIQSSFAVTAGCSTERNLWTVNGRMWRIQS